MPRVRRGGPVVVLLKIRVVCSGCQQHAQGIALWTITFQIKGKRAFGSSIPPRAPWEHMNCWPLDTTHLFGTASAPWQWAVEKQETWGDVVNRQRQWGDRAPLSSMSECTRHRLPPHGTVAHIPRTFYDGRRVCCKTVKLSLFAWIRWNSSKKRKKAVFYFVGGVLRHTDTHIHLISRPTSVWEARKSLSL